MRRSTRIHKRAVNTFVFIEEQADRARDGRRRHQRKADRFVLSKEHGVARGAADEPRR